MLIRAEPEFIKRVATHPRNWRFLSEYGQPPEDFMPTPGTIYLAHGEQGFVAGHRVLGRNTWIVHICMLPKAKDVVEFCSNTLDEFALLMQVHKYVGVIPEDARSAQRLVRHLGFVQEGRITQTLERGPGEYIDSIVFGKVVG